MVARQGESVLQIWRSEHVELYRWVLTFGEVEYKVYHGNASSWEQAMKDVEHCRQIYASKTSLATVY